jgi:hypothetical protein
LAAWTSTGRAATAGEDVAVLLLEVQQQSGAQRGGRPASAGARAGEALPRRRQLDAALRDLGDQRLVGEVRVVHAGDGGRGGRRVVEQARQDGVLLVGDMERQRDGEVATHSVGGVGDLGRRTVARGGAGSACPRVWQVRTA